MPMNSAPHTLDARIRISRMSRAVSGQAEHVEHVVAAGRAAGDPGGGGTAPRAKMPRLVARWASSMRSPGPKK